MIKKIKEIFQNKRYEIIIENYLFKNRCIHDVMQLKTLGYEQARLIVNDVFDGSINYQIFVQAFNDKNEAEKVISDLKDKGYKYVMLKTIYTFNKK